MLSRRSFIGVSTATFACLVAGHAKALSALAGSKESPIFPIGDRLLMVDPTGRSMIAALPKDLTSTLVLDAAHAEDLFFAQLAVTDLSSRPGPLQLYVAANKVASASRRGVASHIVAKAKTLERLGFSKTDEIIGRWSAYDKPSGAFFHASHIFGTEAEIGIGDDLVVYYRYALPFGDSCCDAPGILTERSDGFLDLTLQPHRQYAIRFTPHNSLTDIVDTQALFG